MINVAICGSEDKYWTLEQRTKVVKKIKEIFLYETNKEVEKVTKNIIKSEEYIKTVFWNPYNRCGDAITLISGGCPKGGVDIWAEIVADTLGINKDIKYPEVNQWEDSVEYDDSRINPPEYKKGYKSRNIEMAEACDVLYCIDPKGRKWSGGRWTLTYAKKLGKETHLIEIE